jgi:hypothetical protein
MKCENSEIVLTKADILALLDVASSSSGTSTILFDRSKAEAMASDGSRLMSIEPDSGPKSCGHGFVCIDASVLRDAASRINVKQNVSFSFDRREASIVDEYGRPVAKYPFAVVDSADWAGQISQDVWAWPFFAKEVKSVFGKQEKSDYRIFRMDASLMSASVKAMRERASKIVALDVPRQHEKNDRDASILIHGQTDDRSFKCQIRVEILSGSPLSKNGDPRIGGGGQVGGPAVSSRSAEPARRAPKAATAPRRAAPAPKQEAPAQDWRSTMMDLLSEGRYEEAASFKMVVSNVVVSDDDISLLRELEGAGLLSEANDLRVALFLE